MPAVSAGATAVREREGERERESVTSSAEASDGFCRSWGGASSGPAAAPTLSRHPCWQIDSLRPDMPLGLETSSLLYVHVNQDLFKELY